MAVCQIVASLLCPSSSSKNTLSGLTTRSLLNQAGKTSFFNRLSCLLLIDFARKADAKIELRRPTPAEATKNPPFHGSFF
jgi:hypothetical protein